MGLNDIPPPGYRFALDSEKLWNAFEVKRKQDKLSRDRIAARYGLGKNSFMWHPGKKSYDPTVLIPMLRYLKKDLEEFTKLVEVNK